MVNPHTKPQQHYAQAKHYPDGLPPGQYLWHCGQRIKIVRLPIECPTCHVRLFDKEAPRAC